MLLHCQRRHFTVTDGLSKSSTGRRRKPYAGARMGRDSQKSFDVLPVGCPIGTHIVPVQQRKFMNSYRFIQFTRTVQPSGQPHPVSA